ncbi:MAG: M23 family metallopeptidase [Treponema sp.]|nr:M23 family metallopeptidase [Treponema sp.]
MSLTKAGKGLSLAIFFIFFCLPVCHAQQPFPEISQLNPRDLSFRQLMSDVEANRRRLASYRPSESAAAEMAGHLTIYQYTINSSDDILFLAARTNVPYAALVSLNRLSSPRSLIAGNIMLLPSCPGIFIPAEAESDLELILGAAREGSLGYTELTIMLAGRPQIFRFFPGADFTPTERAYFLNSGFRFPLQNYRITSPYGMRNDPFTGERSMHQGIDFAAPEGTPVYAIADGTVTAAGFDPVYGNYIIISHSNNWTSLYGHLQIIVTALRSEVKSGNLIGRVGSTGQSTGPHLHFELRQDGRAFDPMGNLRH